MTKTAIQTDNQINILENVSLQRLNTLGFAVTARYFCHIKTLQDLFVAHEFTQQHDLPWLLIGGGSNLVLTDDFAGLVMHMNITGKTKVSPKQLRYPSADDRALVYWQAGAGESWDQLVAATLDESCYGLQNLSLIPGTVGAAPIQNIGAYGVDLASVLHEVEVFDFANGKVMEFSNAQCQFDYRDSIFKRHPHWFITKVCLVLSHEPNINTSYGDITTSLASLFVLDPSKATPEQVRQAVIHIRRQKLPDPDVIPNVGSFFKNPIVSLAKAAALKQQYPQLVAYSRVIPAQVVVTGSKGQAQDLDTDLADLEEQAQVKLAAGWLIDHLGWKGRNMGGVGVHDKQALVLVRQGQANGGDLLRLAKAVSDDVEKHFGVRLQVEPRLFDRVGEFSF